MYMFGLNKPQSHHVGFYIPFIHILLQLSKYMYEITIEDLQWTGIILLSN